MSCISGPEYTIWDEKKSHTRTTRPSIWTKVLSYMEVYMQKTAITYPSEVEEFFAQAKKTIKSSYPDVNIENDLTIDIQHDRFMDISSVSLEFQSEETESEKIDRINKDNSEKERKLRELKKFLEENPEVIDEISFYLPE